MTDQPINRVVLGTVQLGLPYGRLRETTLMPMERAWAILDAAWSLGIRAFDTAEAYGDAVMRLGYWLDARRHRQEAEIITKLAPAPERDFGTRSLAAVLPFAGVRRLTVLSHGVAHGEQLAQARAAIPDPRVVLGQSVYTAEEVTVAVSDVRVTRIQAPGNVFDQRALAARGASRCPLDLRSVFLQGLLLDPPAIAEARVAGAGPLASAVVRAARHAGAAREALLIAALLRKARPADRVVIGVDDPVQLESLGGLARLEVAQVSAFVRRVCEEVPGPLDEALLDPRQWATAGVTR
ncbi:MAG: aldo/keto reductase [Gemmatimonadota bacterium]|nr:aldo/keto reductase [Gemmatimonadota bacterium]